MAGGEADRARGEGAARRAGALPVHGAGRAQRSAQRKFCAALAALQFHGRLFPARPRTPSRADRFAFRQRAEALGAWLMAGRSEVRRQLARLVRRVAMPRPGPITRRAAMATNPVAA